MGLTSSLYTGLSGLNANSQYINVTGNNIANANTTGFKGSRISFDTQISQQLSSGSAPGGTSGGTNPAQVGLGVRVGGVTRDFSSGNLQPTGIPTDVAIDGNGFFVLKFGEQYRYSRAGQFSLDRDFNLVNPGGGNVQGYGVDDNFNVVQGQLKDITIPLGVLTLAEPTKNVRFGGNLNAGGDISTLGSITTSGELHTAAGSAAGANLATTATALAGIYDTGGATPLFALGDVIQVQGASRGGATIPNHTFQVGAANTTGSDTFGTTLADFTGFLQNILGIDSTLPGAQGATVTAGQLVITSNTGSASGITLNAANIVKNPGGTSIQPFTFSQSQDATGESVRTTFVAFDSLGNALNVDLTLTLESKANTGTVWRYYVQSEDDAGLGTAMGNGTLLFDTSGQITGVGGGSFNIDRSGTGAASPQTINLQFNHGSNTISSLTDVSSQIASLNQDGSPKGTLQDFTVTGDGTIVGSFSNSLLRDLGRVVLATFTNPQGLVEEGSNLFSENVNSGTPQIYTPGTGGAGRTVGGALEQSNIDLSQEFINLIAASTGFSASSRVLTTSDRLMQELISTIR